MLWVSGRPGGHVEGEVVAADGVPIPYREWHRPAARAAFCYLHGQGDHSGPFAAMGDILAQHGFSVYAHDHRGFGRSPQPRGHIDTYDRFVDDTCAVVDRARARNPGARVWLLGLSMGGHIALRAAARLGPRLDGVVALSPGFKLRRTPWREIPRLAWRLLAAPDRPVAPAVSRRVPTTRNARHVERAAQDECWVTSYTPRFYLATLRSVARARRELPQVRVPVLVLMAGADRLVCAQAARRFFDLVAAADKEFRVLPGLYHNLVVEPEMPEVAQLVVDWAAARMGT